MPLPTHTPPQIVLLNMLIALMRDIYQKVRDTEQDVFLKGRAQVGLVEVLCMDGPA